MSDRPNIVLIVADQMAAGCIGAAGHPVVQTPNLDRLAEHGTLYDHAYCASPVCGPSRASLASGLLVRDHRVFDNGAEFSSEIPTIYHRLSSAGYETVGAGKFHFVGPDQLHGLSRRLTTDIFPSNFAWTPDWSAGISESEGMNSRVVREAREVASNTYIDFDEEVLFRALEFLRQHGKRRGTESTRRRFAPGAATDRTGERDTAGKRAADRPFFLQVSFSHPHPPFEAMRAFLDLYPTDVGMPEHPDLPSAPTRYEEWMITLNRLRVDPLSREETIFARRAYYAMVSYVDSLVGRIVAELERHELLENTVVVFTSDHGEMLGEKGLWFKRTYHEQSVRVPLIVCDPRGPVGSRSASVVSLTDLSSELLRLAGLSGEASSSLADGSAIFEYCGKGTVAPLLGIRRGEWKLVEFPGLMTLLYQLHDDPWELHNRADGERRRVELLRDELAEGMDSAQLTREIRASQARRLVLRDLHRGHHPSWDYQPSFPASEQYIRPTSGS